MIDIFKVARELGLKGKYKDRVYINASGTQAFFICPFKHIDVYGNEYEEKVPSFTINIETGKFYCFSCGSFGTSIQELYKKLGKEYKGDEEVKENIQRKADTQARKLNELYERISSSFSSINYDLTIKYLEYRGIKATKGFIEGFIDFYGINTIDYNDEEKLLVIKENNNPVGIDEMTNVGYICRRFYYDGTNISEDPDKGKYLNIMANGGSFVYPYNRDSIKFLLGNGIILVESIMDSLKLNSYGLKNMSTLGANIRKSFLDYFSSIGKLYQKYYLIPQNDEAGITWLKTLMNHFTSNNILFEIISIPKEYKDLCEIKDELFFVELKTKLVENYELKRI